MELFIGWVLFAVLVGVLASKRGRDGGGWFLLALVLSPVFAGLLVLILDDKSKKAAQPTPETHVRCPECRELVLKDARKCKHCGSALVPQ